jgi:uncharacterized repeat protein (TIGR03803 family)
MNSRAGTDGRYPFAGLVLTGTGTSKKNDFGTVFEITHSMTGWKNHILYSFNATYSGDGNQPHAGVTMDIEGNLYGTTYYGGADNYFGTVYKLSKSQNGKWNEAVLYSFTGEEDGGSPQAGVIEHQGWLYGTTLLGGNNSGVVYQTRP